MYRSAVKFSYSSLSSGEDEEICVDFDNESVFFCDKPSNPNGGETEPDFYYEGDCFSARKVSFEEDYSFDQMSERELWEEKTQCDKLRRRVADFFEELRRDKKKGIEQFTAALGHLERGF